MDTSALRSLPSVDSLLGEPALAPAALRLPRATVTELVRCALAAARESVLRGSPPPGRPNLIEAVLTAAKTAPSLRPVINAAGVILHTNLGRAPLSQEALAAMQAAGEGYSNLEFDLEAGERASRHSHLASLLCRVTGAEDGLAVNNNAAAVFMTLMALCAGREVIVSRGQAVEIGGGFRIPDVLRQSGATLIEVGTTNRTYAADYERAITPDTAAILRVHTSNFRVVGFTAEPRLDELADVAHRNNILLLDDLGSGALFDAAAFGLRREPTPQESLKAGADLVTFSGDKLLGGPQAGIIAGKRQEVAALKKHPLARALRLDKTTIAALATTLEHYVRGEEFEKVPVLRAIATPAEDIRRRATTLARAVGGTVVPVTTMVGGGSLPGEGVPSFAVRIPSPDGAQALAAALRTGNPAVVARIEDAVVLLDLRTVDPSLDRALLAAVKQALAG